MKPLGCASASVRHAAVEGRSYLDECVVQDKHDGCEIPRNRRIEKEHLSNVADISSLRMSQTKLPSEDLEGGSKVVVPASIPDDERRIQNEGGLNDRQDQSGHQTEDGVRIWEGHNSQTDVF